MRRPAKFTRIGPKQATPRRSSTMSSTNGTREADADTPATTTTRPLYVGTGYDVGFAADALGDVDEPWSAAVDAQNTALPDFTPERRWTSVLLGALGIVVLAALVIAVITVAHQSSEPTERAPAPAPPSTSAAAPSPPRPRRRRPCLLRRRPIRASRRRPPPSWRRRLRSCRRANRNRSQGFASGCTICSRGCSRIRGSAAASGPAMRTGHRSVTTPRHRTDPDRPHRR